MGSTFYLQCEQLSLEFTLLLHSKTAVCFNDYVEDLFAAAVQCHWLVVVALVVESHVDVPKGGLVL